MKKEIEISDNPELEELLTTSWNSAKNGYVEEWLADKMSTEDIVEDIVEYSSVNLVNVKCPKCKSKFQHNMKNHALDYFECLDCKQKFALSKEKRGFKLHIDDQEHMGLMTSGPGGY